MKKNSIDASYNYVKMQRRINKKKKDFIKKNFQFQSIKAIKLVQKIISQSL